ncbi:DUF1793 domain-containing protein [Caenorhabditis elegans]|uniref:DUF1793 domain-containing protein n=1 Tax=Caenorhabditis elegans TaxID=6239 RepID=Q19158_CAEEL|nr:DUF1793 domain-containing protein [Caenorhabditis elegans]CAA93484.2 DUF1793 domain-containing protein [Caenorhabditis elegans]|eukprot:NP_502438.2 Uncharacterized protein CELE_F07C6.3 [Caenorhabditis elegans]
MRLSPLFSSVFFVFCVVQYVDNQQVFGSIAFSAIQKIVPHASDVNAFALAQGLNSIVGQYSAQRTLVNKFFSQNKAGSPNPKTLSLYDNSTYSKQKLIALVNNRQAVTQWWSDLTPGITKIYGAAQATKYKNLYAYFDSRYINSFSYTMAYWMMCVLLQNAFGDEADYNATSDLMFDSLEKQLNKSTAIAFEIYTTAFEANHNQTLMKGKW